ncbi:hypothetical protein ACROYT_G041360 [Oculina patagonica]
MKDKEVKKSAQNDKRAFGGELADYGNDKATPDAPITAVGESLDFVEEFTYLGSLVAKDSAAQKDIKARLGKACGAKARLQPVWRSKKYSLRTKLRLYHSIVKPVLSYGAECWRVVKSNMNKLNASTTAASGGYAAFSAIIIYL